MLAAAALASALLCASNALPAAPAASALWLAQSAGPDPARAEPEPPGPPVPRAPIDGGPPDPDNRLDVQARFAYRFAGSGPSLSPSAGVSLGATYEHRYLSFGPGLELGVAADFFHDRFVTGVVGSSMVSPGVEETFDGQRTISQTSFAALQTAGVALGRVRLWLGAGAGVSVGFLSSPEIDLRPGSASAVQPLARGALGVDVVVRGRAGFVVRADYTRFLTHPSFTTDAGVVYRPFGDLFDVGAGFLYRF